MENEKMTFEIYHKDKYENYEAYLERPSKGMHIFDPSSLSEIIQCYIMDDGSTEQWTRDDHNLVIAWIARENIKSKDDFLRLYNATPPEDKASGEYYLKIINYWYDNNLQDWKVIFEEV